MTITLQFFLGEAQHIEGWLVPTHRHPEWDVPRLRQAIARAQSLSQREWKQISHCFDEQYLQLAHEFGRSVRTDRSGPWSWDKWFACLVVYLENEDPSSPTLWIRRDLEEAFLVKDVCPSCQCPTLVRTSTLVHSWQPPDFPRYACQTCGQRSRRSGNYIIADQP